jgi:ABC-2 type transport system ATP-binding protein
MKAIAAENLTRDFDGLRAVDHITFSVAEGEVFGFLGPNGAGKTTTIRMLTGQLRPTEGTARVVGYDVVEERQALKARIGVVFEYQNLYDRLSARDNLIFSARLYGVDRARVDAVLAQVGLADRARDKVKAYSNGMKQRLLIARALLHQPRVLFLDEPTRGLDPHVARDIRAFVAELAQQGVTVFLTTHYMEEADRLSSRVAILHQGQIVALGRPADLKAEHGTGAQSTLEDVFISLTGHPLRGRFEE